MDCECSTKTSEILNGINPKYESIKIQSTVALFDKYKKVLVYIPIPNHFCPVCGAKNSNSTTMED